MPKKQVLSPAARINSFLKENNATGKRLLVAVSGGQDSVCLLHLLHSLKIDLHAAHLNHQLRGQQSDADAQYVFDLCHKLGVPVTIGQADVTGYRELHKLSMEEAARELRYRFLVETAASLKAEMVAVAHTRDDNVETILLHILRGSGTRGLVGLKPVSERRVGGKKLLVLRPLLVFSREETGSYCRVHKLHPRLDSTNLSLEPLRNRVRLELLPLLKTYNYGIDAALLRTARIAAEDNEFLDTVSRKKWRAVVRQTEGKIIFDRKKLTALPVSLQRNLLRLAVEKLTGTLKDIEARHIEEMLAMLRKPAGRQIDLPYDIYFGNEYEDIILGVKRQVPGPGSEPVMPVKIKIPGITVFQEWQVDASFVNRERVQHGDEFTAFVDSDQAGKELTVRYRKSGDRFRPLGMAGEKKVGDFMLDARVPRNRRSQIPLVVNGENVIWLVGLRIDDRVKVTDQTKKVLKLVFKKS